MSAQAFPLQWPAGRARKTSRRSGAFKVKDDRGWMVPIGLPAALDRLDREVLLLGGVGPVLSSDVQRTIRGGLVGTHDPLDPGAALYFTMGGEPFVLACDTFTAVAQNVAALAAHIEATRAITRYGVATAAEALEAFRMLPPPGPENRPPRPWHDVLGVQPDAPLEVIDAAFRALAAKAHPDKGGTAEAMADLTRARADARARA